MISIHSLSELERLKLQETAYHELVARQFLSEFKPDRGKQYPALECGILALPRVDPPGQDGASWGSGGGGAGTILVSDLVGSPGDLRKRELKGVC